MQVSQEKIWILEQQIKEIIEEHESKEIQLKTIIESQNMEISSLKEKLDNHTHKIRLFLLKQSNKFHLKPLPKPKDLNEIMPNEFQTIDFQGLMQGIYKKTEDIFKQLNQKLSKSNETIVKLKEFIIKHSQVIENLQGKIVFLEQENFCLKNSQEAQVKKNDLKQEIEYLQKENKNLMEKTNEKELKIMDLEKGIKQNETMLKDMRELTERLENDLFNYKVKISEVMNEAFENGGAEFVEIIEKALLHKDNW